MVRQGQRPGAMVCSLETDLAVVSMCSTRTSAPPPYTPPTPQLLHASPRTVSRDHYASPAGKVALKPVTLKVGAVGMEGSPRK